MYILAAIPFTLASFWLLVFLFRLRWARAARISRESQIVFWAGLCEDYAGRARAFPRNSSEWLRFQLLAERMAMQAFDVLSSRRPALVPSPLSVDRGRAAERFAGVQS